MSNPIIRDATEADLPRIVDIYNSSVPHRMATADTEPVSVDSRRPWFDAHSPDHHPLWVFERDGVILAWVGLHPFYGRPAYNSTAEISIYVAEEAQRHGIASQLIDYMIAHCPNLEIKTLLAFVFAHNDPSVKVFERAGFVTWGHLPKVAQLDDNWRDLLIMGRKV